MGTRCAISRGRQAPACFEDQRSVWQVFGGFADAWVAAIALNKAAKTAGADHTAPAAQSGAKLPDPAHACVARHRSLMRATQIRHPAERREHAARRAESADHARAELRRGLPDGARNHSPAAEGDFVVG